MNHEELFDALTNIDDDLILEAHETPVSRRTWHRSGGLRRAAVLVAAVVALAAMSVVAAAASVDPSVLSAGTNSCSGAKWPEGYQSVGVEQSLVFNVGGTEYGCYIYTTQSPDTALASIRLESGETLEVIYEAEILLPDGTVARKTVTKHGTGHANVYMTNKVEGKSGIILKTRVHFFRITADGQRLLVNSWQDTLNQKYYKNAPEGYTSEWPDDDPPITASTKITEDSVVVVIKEPTN